MSMAKSGSPLAGRLSSVVAFSLGALTLSLTSAGPALAGGLLLYEVGTADVGLASAGYSARAQDASTVLTNPAGMTLLEGKQVLLGTQILYTDPSFSISSGTSPALGTANGGNPVGFFPAGSAFYTQKLSPKLSVGFGLAGNFGLSVDYNDGWAGRYYFNEGTLIGASLLPSIAYQINDKLSVGASLNAMYGISEIKVAVNNITGPDGSLKVEDEEWGWGGNLGVMYQISPTTRLGLTYTSEVDLDFGGNAEFSGLAPGLEALLGSRGLLNAPIDIGITVPQTLMVSLFTQLDPKWALLVSAGWQDWSAFGRVDISVDSSNPTSLTTDAPFQDTWHGAVGGQYQLSEPWLMNFGIAYDSAFQEGSTVSVALPSNDLWRFGVGAQQQTTRSFHWGVAGAYTWGGTLDVDLQSPRPVAVGGRGNLKGSFRDTQGLFVSAHFGWNF
jgi:long-chain fatty acid transport protein